MQEGEEKMGGVLWEVGAEADRKTQAGESRKGFLKVEKNSWENKIS